MVFIEKEVCPSQAGQVMPLPPLTAWQGGGDALTQLLRKTENNRIRLEYALSETSQWALAGMDDVCLCFQRPAYIKLDVCGKASAPVNLEVKFLDERGNVFIARMDGVELCEHSKILEIEPADIRYGWGPDGAHEPASITRVEVAVSRYQQDTEGWVEFGEWMMEALDDPEWYRQTLSCRINRCRGLIGWENCENKVPVSCAGTVASDTCRFMVHTWFYDHVAKLLLTPETMHPVWRIEDCGVPVYHIDVAAECLSIEIVLFAFGDADGIDVYCRAYITNQSQECRTVSALRMFQPNSLVANGEVSGVCLEDGYRLKINEGRSLLVDPPCEKCLPEFADAARKARAVFLGPDNPAVRKRNVMLAQQQVVNAGETVVMDYVLPRAGRSYFDLPFDEALARTRFYWLKRVPLRLSLPDQRIQDMFYASIHYQLMMMHDDKLCPGPRDYKRFFLHDAVDMINSLNIAGLQPLVHAALRHFVYGVNGEDKLYFDGIGGCIFARYEYFRFSGDRACLVSEYETIIDYARQLVDLLAVNRTAEKEGTVFFGLMPPSKSQDNWNYPAHLYVDNWWTLIGLKSALDAARVLGANEHIVWLDNEVNRLSQDLMASMTRVCEREGTDWVPGFADAWGPEMQVIDAEHRILGDTQMAWAHRPAFYPGLSLGLDVPEELLHTSYEKYWRDAGRFSGYDGGWFVEYEKVFWGYNGKLAYPMMALGMPDVTLQNVNWLLENQSAPMAWMEAMPAKQNEEGYWRVDTQAGIIGDVPHGWSAAHVAILVRSMLLREEADILRIFSGIPKEWLYGGETVSVEHAPTIFGPVSFSVAGCADTGSIELTLDVSAVSDRCKTICLHLPEKIQVLAIRHSALKGDIPVADGQILLPVQSGTVMVSVSCG